METKTETRKLVNAWIDPEDAERLDDVARAADRSRSAELRIAIRAYLERDDENEEEDDFELTVSRLRITVSAIPEKIAPSQRKLPT